MTIQQRVEAILKHDEASRNSDKRLLVVYLQKSGMELTERQIALFMKLPSTETLRRTRQQLQEQGKYRANPKVEEVRYQKFKQVRQNINSESAESVLKDQHGNQYNLPEGW